MLLLARSLKLDHTASFLAAFIFAFSESRHGVSAYIHLLTIQWVPFALVFIHKYFDKGRRIFLYWAALFYLIQITASAYHCIFFSIILLMVIFILFFQQNNFKLKKLVRGRLRQALKGKKLFTTMELIGCTVDELKKHLESKFEPWMNWENQGRGGWDIDHIIAMSKFDLSCPVQQHACCHWSNLQPLGHIANIKKGTK